MSIRGFVALFACAGGACIGWFGLAPPSATTTMLSRTVSASDPTTFHVDLETDGFHPGRLEINLGQVPIGTDAHLTINFRNNQARSVRFFGNSSSCNQYGCSRTTIAEEWVEPGAVAQIKIEPLFKASSTLGAEAIIYAGSDRLFEWSISMRGERGPVAK